MCLSIVVDHPEVLIEKGIYQDYKYNITHNYSGYRCGYIQLKSNHPWFGKSTNNIHANVHGNITFSEADKPCHQESVDNNWWIGIDTMHFNDAPDFTLPIKINYFIPIVKSSTIKTTEFVRSELFKLIDQAKKLEAIYNFEYTLYYS